MPSPQSRFSSRTTLRLWNLLALYIGVLLTMWAVTVNLEAPFLRLDTAINHPGAIGPFRQRLLFIGVAWLFKLAIPGLLALQYFKLSQLVAAIFTFFVMRAWVRVFVGEEWEWLGSLLLAAMLVPVMAYHNFHDISVVGFYAACLMLLFRKRFVPYMLVYAVGLWNHENLLMVAGVAFIYLWLEGEVKQAVKIAAIQGVIFVLHSIALQHLVPGDRMLMSAAGFALNLHPIASYGIKTFILVPMKLAFPIAAAVLAYRYSPRILKLALPIHFAALFTGTFLYGRFDEARQWNTMFAIIVPMTVILLQRIVRGSEPARADVGNAENWNTNSIPGCSVGYGLGRRLPSTLPSVFLLFPSKPVHRERVASAIRWVLRALRRCPAAAWNRL
jgi:hypothetical protein